uniref:Chloride channel-like (CLC) protein, putative n=1 Tax=Arundo donax TaxID=35708 RepID=A0A0A9F2B0_ARUDO
MASPREDLPMEEDENRPPLTRALLHRSATNNTSQVAMVGSNPCPIESLDYEMIENDLFDQNWRTRAKADQVRYVVLKWTFCFAIGILTGIVGFVINLAVENIAGFKHAAVSALMESSSYWTAFWVFAGSNLVFLLFASSITAFVSPAAGGSGIPEVKAYLNGVDAPNIFSLRTLAVKNRLQFELDRPRSPFGNEPG